MTEENALLKTHPAGDPGKAGFGLPGEAQSLDTFAGKVQIRWVPDGAVSTLGLLPFFTEFLKTSGLFDAFVVARDTRSVREISCRLAPFACSSRIAVRCAWLSMSRFLFLSDSFRHSVQFTAGAFDPALRLLLLHRVHLRQCLA